MSNGNWTSGGTGNDWVWGSPSKPIITGAASGTKCWINGGLTGSFYTYGSRNWVQSPCFNFSTLVHPYIELSIFWDSERTYDGAQLQYSTNNGTTWTTVGTNNEATNCNTANWYNTASITNLNGLTTTKYGWAGTVRPSQGSCNGGGGSGAWMRAKHCLTSLAGSAQVIFRIAFGAGTTCNNYDGFGFDNIYIGEAPAMSPSFQYNCDALNGFTFTDLTQHCPTTWAWNFGDPASGAANQSTLQNPSHNFSAPGNYNVTLVAGNTCEGSGTTTVGVTVQGFTVTNTPETCTGAHNGTATATLTPVGSGSVDFFWSTTPPSTGVTTNNLAPGTYTVTMSNGNGCTGTQTFTIGTTARTATTHVLQNPPCSTATTGSADVTVSGNTTGVTYLWSNGATTNTVNNIGVGTHYVTLTYPGGCTAVDSVVLTAPPTPALTTQVVQPITCTSGNIGSISVSVAGNPGGLSYLWSNGGTTATLTGLGGGNYFVTVTFTGGCTAVDSVALIYPLSAAVNTQIVQALNCPGVSNGSVSVIVAGNPPGSTYIWSNGATTATISSLGSGTYTVTVNLASGCTASSTISLIPAVLPAITTQLIQPVYCAGATSGSVSVSITGNPSGITYLWSNGATNQTNSGLSAGLYHVTATFPGGCTATDTISVPLMPIRASTLQIAHPITCDSLHNGRLMVINTGNISGISYLWNTGATTSSIAGLSAGHYQLTLTYPGNCTVIDSIALPGIVPLVLSLSSHRPSCHNNTDGQITAHLINGTPPYHYQLLSNTPQTDSVFANLSAGNYLVTATDASGCSATDSTVLTNPAQLTISVLPSDTIINSGDSVQLNITTNFTPLLNWLPPTSLSCLTCTSPFASPLITTTYTITATDSVGCTTEAIALVRVRSLREVYIPNFFSPNGDGNNDVFYIQSGKGLARVNTLRIYDKWGEMVFESLDALPNNPAFGWDGTFKGQVMQEGVFAYYGTITYTDGKQEFIKGDFTLVR